MVQLLLAIIIVDSARQDVCSHATNLIKEVRGKHHCGHIDILTLFRMLSPGSDSIIAK
jgi:hypothetical protein